MRPEQFGMAVFVSVILAVALWRVGSPGYARKLEQDRNTTREMTRLARVLKKCSPPEETPPEGSVADLKVLCPDTNIDTFTVRRLRNGVRPLPIRYVIEDDDVLRLCADLHYPAEAVEHLSGIWVLDPETGCLEVNRPA